MLPLVGFIHGDDRPTTATTIDAIERDLASQDAVTRGLLHRYRAEAGDGLSGREGAFAILRILARRSAGARGSPQRAQRPSSRVAWSASAETRDCSQRRSTRRPVSNWAIPRKPSPHRPHHRRPPPRPADSQTKGTRVPCQCDANAMSRHDV